MNDLSWNAIKKIVEEGKARECFPIGTQFSVLRKNSEEVSSELRFDVVDYDLYCDEEHRNTLVLMMHDTWYGHPMDVRESFYFCENGLSPGEYWFKVKNQFWYPADDEEYFYFNLSHPIPNRSLLWLDMKYNETLEGKKISVFLSGEYSLPSQTLLIQRGKVGTYLGSTDGSSKNMNHMHRAVFGSNNYKESSLRQWLNSNQERGKWWQPQNQFDMPPASAFTEDGFTYGMDSSFLSVINTVPVSFRYNSTYEQDSDEIGKIDTVYNKFFVPSLGEVGFDDDSPCNVPFSAFKDDQKNRRMKKNFLFPDSPERRWWLRSPKRENASSFYLVDDDGSLFVHTGYYGFGVAACCVI